MADLTYQEAKEAVEVGSKTALNEYTYGRGNAFLQVILAGNNVKQLIDEAKKNTETIKKNIDTIDDMKHSLDGSTKVVDENTKALEKHGKKVEDATKEIVNQGRSWTAIMEAGIKIGSEIAGFLKERAVREMELTNSISETNTMYAGTAKELNTYANRMNMSLDEYTAYMKENAAEYNNLQRTFNDVREATALDWKKIAQQSGATTNEMNKSLAAYTKMVSNSGEINSMTTKEFNEGASEYIKETKLLAKALGVSTEAINKQVEQAQKQWQYDLLMRDPTKQAQIKAAQALGHDMDQILYEVGGIMSEGAATQMALSPAKAMEMQTWRERSARGDMDTQEQIEQYAKDMNNNAEFRQLQREQEERLRQNTTMLLYANDEKFAKAYMGSTGEQYNKLANLAQIDREKEAQSAQNANQAATNELQGQVKQLQNNAEAVTMAGKELAKNLNTISSTLEAVNKRFEKISQSEISGQIAGKLQQVGLILGSILPVIAGGWAAIKSVGAAKNMLGIGAKAAGKMAGKATTKAAAKVGAKTATKLGGKALAKSAAKKIPGLGALAGILFAGSRLMEGDLKGAGLEVASGLLGSIPGLGTAGSAMVDGYLFNRDLKNAKLKDNAPAQIASSSVENKAEVQQQVKMKAEAEAEAQQQFAENTEENILNPFNQNEKSNIFKFETEDELQIKLSQVIAVLNEISNRVSMMEIPSPMTNYHTI